MRHPHSWLHTSPHHGLTTPSTPTGCPPSSRVAPFHDSWPLSLQPPSSDFCCLRPERLKSFRPLIQHQEQLVSQGNHILRSSSAIHLSLWPHLGLPFTSPHALNATTSLLNPCFCLASPNTPLGPAATCSCLRFVSISPPGGLYWGCIGW